MKHFTASVFLLCTLLILSCNEEEEPTPEPAVTKNTRFLTGGEEEGSWKRWVMNGFHIKKGNSFANIFEDAEPCLVDNIFEFSLASKQSYRQAPGPVPCDPALASSVEYGSWYFTSSGLKITVIVFADDVIDEDAALFAYFPVEWDILKLTEDFFAIEYKDEDGIVYTVSFKPL